MAGNFVHRSALIAGIGGAQGVLPAFQHEILPVFHREDHRRMAQAVGGTVGDRAIAADLEDVPARPHKGRQIQGVVNLVIGEIRVLAAVHIPAVEIHDVLGVRRDV